MEPAMNTPLPLLYANDAYQEFLPSPDKPAFTGERIARFSEEPLAVIQKTRPTKRPISPLASIDAATEGSHSRDGGVIAQASSS
jgi:hypothetical protein